MEQEKVVKDQAQALQTKYCKYCGAKIPMDAVVCTACGRQVENLSWGAAQPYVTISNTNMNTNTNISGLRAKDKWVALLLCFFLGLLGAHKFYEGKIGMGILYIFTCGLFGIGTLIDFFVLLFKPNPYYVI